MLTIYKYLLKTKSGKYIHDIKYHDEIFLDKNLRILPKSIKNVSTHTHKAHIFKTDEYESWNEKAQRLSEFIGEKIEVVRL